MKVKELIEELNKYNGEIEAKYCDCTFGYAHIHYVFESTDDDTDSTIVVLS